MRTAAEILRAHSIEYIATRRGKFTTTCPNCSGGYLNVEEKQDSVVWYCPTCQQGGGEKYQHEQRKSRKADGDLGPIKAIFDYHDEAAERLFQVLKFEPINAPKAFRQRTGPDQEKWSIKGVRRVLYGLSGLIEDIARERVVFVVEGEKDVETLRKHGVPATTNPMGATTVEKQEKGSGWLDCYTETLRGADVVICGDNDAPGREHVRIVARKLHGVVGRLRILDLKQFWPEIEQSGDITDWFEAGATVERLWQIVEELPDYVPSGGNGHDAWEGDDFGPQPSAQGVEQPAADVALPFTAEELDKMRFDPIKFVVPGYIVEGLTLFAGKPKIGKSWLLLHAAIAVARGSFTLGDIHCIEGDVLYCALEDNKRRLQSRMTKLLGTSTTWPRRLSFACEMPRLTEGGLDYIKKWVEDAKQPRLVVIDVLAMVRMPNRKDLSTYDADYQAVKELRALAHKNGIAVVLVHHLRKAEADDAFDTISGTLGLTGAPDTIMVIKRDSNGATLHARGRDLIEIEKAVRFDATTCVWTILGDASEVRRSSERNTVVEALAEAGEPLGPNQVAAACGLKPTNARQLLSRMKADGIIKKASYGKYTLSKQEKPA